MSRPLKPTKELEWATAPAAGDYDEPDDARKASGWTIIKPPLQWFNWWMNLSYKWQIYFERRLPEYSTSAASVSPDAMRNRYYFIDATTGARNVTLPAIVAGADDGLEIGAKKIDGSANTVTFVGTVEGEANPVIEYQYTGRTVVAYGGNWFWKS